DVTISDVHCTGVKLFWSIRLGVQLDYILPLLEQHYPAGTLSGVHYDACNHPVDGYPAPASYYHTLPSTEPDNVSVLDSLIDQSNDAGQVNQAVAFDGVFHTAAFNGNQLSGNQNYNLLDFYAFGNDNTGAPGHSTDVQVENNVVALNSNISWS